MRRHTRDGPSFRDSAGRHLKSRRCAVESGFVTADPLSPGFEQEQNEALERLRERYATGALTLDELKDRVDQAYTAETTAELEEALGDLSAFPAVVPGSSLLEPHLVRDEHVLWVGWPDPAKRFNKGDIFAVPFSVMWAAFSVFWEASALASGPFFFALWGVPFLAIGLYMVIGRFFYKARMKRRTVYAVTDKRVLKLLQKNSGDVLDAAFIDALPAVNRDVRADGSGSVVFGGGSNMQAQFGNNGMPSFFLNNMQVPLSFYDIPDAAHVAELVTELRREGPSPSRGNADGRRR